MQIRKPSILLPSKHYKYLKSTGKSSPRNSMINYEIHSSDPRTARSRMVLYNHKYLFLAAPILKRNYAKSLKPLSMICKRSESMCF